MNPIDFVRFSGVTTISAGLCCSWRSAVIAQTLLIIAYVVYRFIPNTRIRLEGFPYYGWGIPPLTLRIMSAAWEIWYNENAKFILRSRSIGII